MTIQIIHFNFRSKRKNNYLVIIGIVGLPHNVLTFGTVTEIKIKLGVGYGQVSNNGMLRSEIALA